MLLMLRSGCVGIQFLLLSLAFKSGLAARSSKPHVVFVLADDFGWGNLGLHRRSGQSADEKQARAEAQTPEIDGLAEQGIILDRHYTYKICSPSRSALQTGRLPVHVNTLNTGVTSINPGDPQSGFAGIPRNMTGLARKLRDGGYRTHMVGKWDAGMATPDHTPEGRGYETWLGYYQHANDYWRKNTVFQATGEVDICLNRLNDFSMHNATYRGGVLDAASMSAACQKDPESDPGCYEEHLFKERALQVIRQHDASKAEEPLFLFYAFHLLHTPLEVPQFYLKEIDRRVEQAGAKPFTDQLRRVYAAMALYMDDAIGEVVAALKAKGMWDDTLLVFASDNGGPTYFPGSANNHPLKGAKFSDWEGGIRTNALLAGGFIPSHRRNSTFSGVISIADWYGTLAELAGVDPEDQRAEAANEMLRKRGLPLLSPVDSVAQWGFILNDTNGRSDLFHISENAVMKWPLKLVTGKQMYSAWTGPIYPNCSSLASFQHDGAPAATEISILGMEVDVAPSSEERDRVNWIQDCGEGCLVNVMEDPTEHTDLAQDPAYAETLHSMQEALRRLNQGNFHPDRGHATTDACFVAIDHGRYLGPFVDIDGWYSPVEPSEQASEDAVLKMMVTLLNNSIVKFGVNLIASHILPTVFQAISHREDKCLEDKATPPRSLRAALIDV